MQRATFGDAEISVEYACRRTQRAAARKARRQWIERAGQAAAATPMWTSRKAWIEELTAWLGTEDGAGECKRRTIRPELVVRVAMVMSVHADHRTGRNCAITNRTAAAGAGVSERSVSTVRQVLAHAGLAVEAYRGTGSATAPGMGRRPSIWHLVSRRQAAVCDLPPSQSDRRLSPVGINSPNARTRAWQPKSDIPAKGTKRGRRFAPRPLHVQLIAAEILANSHGLDRGHIGTICDALTNSGLDIEAWSPRQLMRALNADMKTQGWSWPDQVAHPAGFLRSRLRRLPNRPSESLAGLVGDCRTGRGQAQQECEQDALERRRTQERTARWHAQVLAATSAKERTAVLRAHYRMFGRIPDPALALASAGRRAARLHPELELGAALRRWVGEVNQERRSVVAVQQVSPMTSLSADLLMDQALGNCDCVVCGSHDAIARPQLPLQSMVCQRCWPVIAAELAGSGADQESRPA